MKMVVVVVVMMMMISSEPVSSAAAPPTLYIQPASPPRRPELEVPQVNLASGTQRMMSRSSTEEPTMLLAAVIRLR